VNVVSIVDEHSRECLVGPMVRSVTGDRLIDEPESCAHQ